MLKLEYLQPSGSFKSRGMGNYLLSHLPGQANSNSNSSASTPSEQSETLSQPAAHFYSSSGGNAGLACVTAAFALGCPCTVVVPISTKPLMIAKLRAAGAHDVVQIGASWAEADRYLREELLGKDKSGVYVPPFDHPDVWAGNSTLVPELVNELSRRGDVAPTALVCSVGGGGLFCGIKQGLAKAPSSWADTKVLAVETYGADSLYAAVKANSLVSLDKITSQATSLGAVRVAEQAFRYAQQTTGQNPVSCTRVSDEQSAAACVLIADKERAVVELACGASVAAVIDKKLLAEALGKQPTKDDLVVIVLCGGSNVTVEMLAEWRQAARV
jgi:L-serine/L-threonine ammonia-lyase